MQVGRLPIGTRTSLLIMRRSYFSSLLPTIRSLMAQWKTRGDRDTGLVLADALHEAGFKTAADDLNWSLRKFPRFVAHRRAKLVKRILSELEPGARVIEQGVWPGYGPDILATRRFVAIEEPRRKRVLLWERTSNLGNWSVWGTYVLKDFANDVREMMRVLRSDLRYESIPARVRVAMRQRLRELEE